MDIYNFNDIYNLIRNYYSIDVDNLQLQDILQKFILFSIHELNESNWQLNLSSEDKSFNLSVPPSKTPKDFIHIKENYFLIFQIYYIYGEGIPTLKFSVEKFVLGENSRTVIRLSNQKNNKSEVVINHIIGDKSDEFYNNIDYLL